MRKKLTFLAGERIQCDHIQKPYTIWIIFFDLVCVFKLYRFFPGIAAVSSKTRRVEFRNRSGDERLSRWCAFFSSIIGLAVASPWAALDADRRYVHLVYFDDFLHPCQIRSRHYDCALFSRVWHFGFYHSIYCVDLGYDHLEQSR